jgi:hypothetical protein
MDVNCIRFGSSKLPACDVIEEAAVVASTED